MGRMKIKRERTAANCLVGKIFTHERSQYKGLKITIQQVWRTIKEVKVESMGENIFLFKFGSEEEKKRILMGGSWHFDRALIVL